LQTNSKKKALVFNRYLSTAGGGERACLDLCVALECLGYSITLVTAPTFKGDLHSLRAVFGISSGADWRLERLNDEGAIAELCRRDGFQIFVNNTYLSSMPNPAPIGIYLLMFPQHISDAERSSLASYSAILTISEFSRVHLEYRWGPGFPNFVLPPPISSTHSATTPEFAQKERLILLVGRFNVDGHNKRQLDAIRAFRRLKDSKVLGADWRLQVAGNLNSGGATRRYFERCLREGNSWDIKIDTNVPFAELQDHYRRASCLWQFTGLGLIDGEEPQHCEHLGLVALDSLSYGTIPVVFERSGVSYLIEHGKNGFIFGGFDDLTPIMGVLDRGFGSPTHHAMFRSAIDSSSRFGFDSYVSTLRSIVAEVETGRVFHHGGLSREDKQQRSGNG